MATEREEREGTPIPTAGVPTIYTNFASIGISFHDIRVYFGEASPRELGVQLEQGAPARPGEAAVAPRVCIVTSPEFARNLRDALSDSIQKYESQFGFLRPNPPSPPPPASAE